MVHEEPESSFALPKGALGLSNGVAFLYFAQSVTHCGNQPHAIEARNAVQCTLTQRCDLVARVVVIRNEDKWKTQQLVAQRVGGLDDQNAEGVHSLLPIDARRFPRGAEHRRENRGSQPVRSDTLFRMFRSAGRAERLRAAMIVM